MAEPAPKYFRLSPGKEVRLRGAFFVTATDFDADADGNVTKVYATYDPETRGGNAPDGRKVKSTMHWVSAAHAVDATVALYERLFAAPVPGEASGDVFDDLAPNSLELLTGCKVEPALADAAPGAGRPVRAARLLRRRSERADVVPPHRRPPRRVGQHPEALHLSGLGSFRPRPQNERRDEHPRSVRSWLRWGGTTFDGHEPTNSLGARCRPRRGRPAADRLLGRRHRRRPPPRRSAANRSRPGAPRPLRRSRATRPSTRSASSTPATTSAAGARRSVPAARCGSISPRTFPPTPPPCRCR